MDVRWLSTFFCFKWGDMVFGPSSTNYGKQTLGFYLYSPRMSPFWGIWMITIWWCCGFVTLVVGWWLVDRWWMENYGWMMTIRCCGFVTLVVWNDISNAFSALSSCNLRFPFMLISGSIYILTFFIFLLTSPLAIALTCPLLKFLAMIHFRRQHFPLVVVLEWGRTGGRILNSQ